MEVLWKGLRYVLQSIGTVFSAPIVFMYVNWVAHKNKNSVIYLGCTLHNGDLAIFLSFIPSEKKQIIMLTDARKKEFANLFSTKDVKFVFYGKLIYKCMLNQRVRHVFSGLQPTKLVANSKVINLRDLQINWGGGARLLLNINLYTCAKRELEALANPLSIQQTSLLRPAECAPRESADIEWCFDASSLPPALEGINPQKTIVLNPYAQSVKYDAIALFELIAERATQMGYSALCCIYGKQKGLKACAGVECTLKEIGTFLARGATLVALRSGFVDVMLHTGCKIASLLPEDMPCSWRLDSEEVASINPNVADIIITSDYSATVDEVFLRLAELKQKDRQQ